MINVKIYKINNKKMFWMCHFKEKIVLDPYKIQLKSLIKIRGKIVKISN